MSKPCVFCEIIAGRSPAQFVYTWPDAVAFVPLNPVVPGHTLVVPRVHVDDAVADPIVTAVTFARAAWYAPRFCGSCNLITSAGAAATQTVFHLHVHIVPREHGDGLPLPWTPQQESWTWKRL